MSCNQILCNVLQNILITWRKLFSVTFQESLKQSGVRNISCFFMQVIHCVVLQTDCELL